MSYQNKEIIFFLPNFSQGGASESTVKLMTYLKKKGFECSLICLGNCFYKKELKKNKIKLVEIEETKTFYAMFKIRKFIEKNKNKKIFFISNINYSNVLSIIFLRKFENLKIILYERTPIQELNFSYCEILRFIKNLIIRILIKYTYPKADKIIANSKTTSKDLSLHIKKRVKTIYSKSIKKIFKYKQVKKSDVTNILWVGRFSNEKSFVTLIDAIYLLKSLKIKITVLGDSPEKEIYVKKIKQLNLKKSFKFLGYKSKIDTIFKNSNLYVSTSLYESFPNSIIQAINYSLPIISSKSFGGVNEILKNQTYGTFYEAGNSRDLADKILNFIKKPKKFLYKAKLAHKSLHNYEFHKLEEKFLKEILF